MSDLIIKGMEMPKNCLECELKSLGALLDEYYCPITKIDCLSIGRQDDCPLEEVPSAQPELPEWAQKVEEYRKSAPSFVRNQLVWALYQTWKEYDGRLVHQRGKENR